MGRDRKLSFQIDVYKVVVVIAFRAPQDSYDNCLCGRSFSVKTVIVKDAGGSICGSTDSECKGIILSDESACCWSACC